MLEMYWIIPKLSLISLVANSFEAVQNIRAHFAKWPSIVISIRFARVMVMDWFLEHNGGVHKSRGYIWDRLIYCINCGIDSLSAIARQYVCFRLSRSYSINKGCYFAVVNWNRRVMSCLCFNELDLIMNYSNKLIIACLYLVARFIIQGCLNVEKCV